LDAKGAQRTSNKKSFSGWLIINHLETTVRQLSAIWSEAQTSPVISS
jgi:hypothetical protein